MKTKKLFSQNLVRIYEGSGYKSVIDLAEKVGVSRIQVYRWMSGETMPSAQNIDALARVLNTEISCFFLSDRKSA